MHASVHEFPVPILLQVNWRSGAGQATNTFKGIQGVVVEVPTPNVAAVLQAC